MTFDPTIPQPNDLLSQSQADLQTNFTQSNVIFGLDHVNFDNSLPLIGTLGYLTVPADEGKHTIIHNKMILAATAAPATAANEGAIYAKEVAGGGRVEYFYRYPNSGPIMQLSAIKAWCVFNGTLATPIAIIDGYNVTNVTKTGTGLYTLNFTTNLSNTTYGVLIVGAGTLARTTATALNTVSINTRNASSGLSTDDSRISVLIIGN